MGLSLSRAEVAAMAGLSVDTIRRMDAGRLHDAKFTVGKRVYYDAEKAAEALGIGTDRFLKIMFPSVASGVEAYLSESDPEPEETAV